MRTFTLPHREKDELYIHLDQSLSLKEKSSMRLQIHAQMVVKRLFVDFVSQQENPSGPIQVLPE